MFLNSLLSICVGSIKIKKSSFDELQYFIQIISCLFGFAYIALLSMPKVSFMLSIHFFMTFRFSVTLERFKVTK